MPSVAELEEPARARRASVQGPGVVGRGAEDGRPGVAATRVLVSRGKRNGDLSTVQ